MTAGQVLAECEALFARLDPERAGVEPALRLEWLRLARRVARQASGLALVLAAEAEHAQASERLTGTPLKTWLGRHEPLSRSEASGVVYQARSIGEHSAVAGATASGRVSVAQARSITKVLDGLAPRLDASQQRRAEELMVGWAGRMDARQLEGSVAEVLAEVVPSRADELLEERLQREAEAAQNNRSLRFFREGASIRFEGSLPRVGGEQFVSMISAGCEALRRTAIEARDPLAVRVTLEQRRADALMALLSGAARHRPVAGGGGARVIVTLDYARLQADAAGAGLIAGGRRLSAGELRQLCCDAELVPAVLGGPSEVLDVGRSRRLVTPEIRTALVLRDGCCAFPGCDVAAELCEAHHVVPWWAGGRTALSNLVLLCHSHHGIVEPARHAIREQWEVRIGDGGLPEFLPPRRLDASRTPIAGSRHGPELARAG